MWYRPGEVATRTPGENPDGEWEGNCIATGMWHLRPDLGGNRRMPDPATGIPGLSTANSLFARLEEYRGNMLHWYSLLITIVDTPGDDPDLRGTENAERISGNSGNDTIYGLGGSDYLEGGNELDTLFGGEGDDMLDPGKNQDTSYGGPGNDYYLIYGDEAGAQDTLVEYEGEGFDWVRSSQNGYALPDNIEGLLLHNDGGGFASDGSGNALANVIVGQEFDNHIWGLGGDD